MPSATIHLASPTTVVLRYLDRSAVFGSYDAGQHLKNGLLVRDRTWDDLRHCWLIADAAATERALGILRRECKYIEVIEMGSTYGNGFEHLFADLPARLRKPTAWALARVLHPDMGGDHEAMAALNQAIDLAAGAADLVMGIVEAADHWSSSDGPCAVCGVLIRRYGDEGGPLCEDRLAKITTRKGL